MLKLLIADDHPLYRDALRGSLQLSFSALSLYESCDIDSTLEQLQHHRDIDLLLLDLNMPGANGLLGLMHIRKLFSDIPVAIISGTADADTVNKAITAGAQGFIPKTANSQCITEAINTILDGDIWIPENLELSVSSNNPCYDELSAQVASLTPAQYRVLCFLKEGLLNKQIADKLNISEATVKAHITALFKKLNINNRSQAVIVASQLQLSA